VSAGRALEGKTAVITGAGAGIGRAMAVAFSGEGASVFVADIDRDGADETVRLLEEERPGSAWAVSVDVSRADSVHRLADEVNARAAVDVLCNNAGIFDDYLPAPETSEELWDRVNDVNVKGPYLMSAAFLPGMLTRGSGVIINTASIASVVAGAGGVAYTASKHAVLGLTRQMAFDHGRAGIRVNAICPGAVATEMSERAQGGGNPHIDRLVGASPFGRWAQPEEIARVAVFLAGSDSAVLHGTPVLADGGWTLS
jgi:NAD(P)-dependent dehydrogenase (short-subunit alcohol dehydrogenase family)